MLPFLKPNIPQLIKRNDREALMDAFQKALAGKDIDLQKKLHEALLTVGGFMTIERLDRLAEESFARAQVIGKENWEFVRRNLDAGAEQSPFETRYYKETKKQEQSAFHIATECEILSFRLRKKLLGTLPPRTFTAEKLKGRWTTLFSRVEKIDRFHKPGDFQEEYQKEAHDKELCIYCFRKTKVSVPIHAPERDASGRDPGWSSQRVCTYCADVYDGGKLFPYYAHGFITWCGENDAGRWQV